MQCNPLLTLNINGGGAPPSIKTLKMFGIRGILISTVTFEGPAFPPAFALSLAFALTPALALASALAPDSLMQIRQRMKPNAPNPRPKTQKPKTLNPKPCVYRQPNSSQVTTPPVHFPSQGTRIFPPLKTGTGRSGYHRGRPREPRPGSSSTG